MREALSILFLSTATLAAGQGVSPQLPATAAGAQNDSKPKVTINIPETILSDKIQIRYFLTGEFGGYGDYVRQQKKHHSYEIVAAIKDKPAGDIKIIAYSPGCAFKTYEFRFKEAPDPQAEFMCELLPHVTLQGQIVPKSILVRS